MKQPEDNKTLDLPLPARRGRPRNPDAMTNAQRQRRWRERHQPMDIGQMAKTIRELAQTFDMTEQDVTRALLRFALRNRNWKQLGIPNH